MRKKIIAIALTIVIISCLVPTTSFAQPYGTSVYGKNTTYGGQTSLSILTSGDVNIPITPTNNGTLATSNSSVIVTSTDVKGYKLYIRALGNTSMDNLGSQLPASSNTLPANLSINTWGFNTDNSSDYIGISLTDSLIRSVSLPVPNGDTTTISYGINIDFAKPAGNYTASVVYTAVPQTD